VLTVHTQLGVYYCTSSHNVTQLGNMLWSAHLNIHVYIQPQSAIGMYMNWLGLHAVQQSYKKSNCRKQI